MKLSKLQKNVIGVFVVILVALAFQNCGKFSAVSGSDSLNSLSLGELPIPTGLVYDPDTQTETRMLFVDDMVLTSSQVSGLRAGNLIAGNLSAGAIDTQTVKWPTKKIYLKRNPNIPFDNETQFRKVMDGVLAACEKWKAVSDIECFEITGNQVPPDSLSTVWVGLSQVQFRNPSTGQPMVDSSGAPINYCGMLTATYLPFSCATVGYKKPIVDVSTGKTTVVPNFIAISLYHIDQDHTYAHEVGHLLGLSHVQNRADRDNFISLNQNFPPNFARINDYKASTTLPGNGDSFDFASLMAYKFKFSKDAAFLNFQSNLSRLMNLVAGGAVEYSNPGHSDYVALIPQVSAGAFAYRDEYFDAGYAANRSGREAGGAYPSKKDAAAVVELYGPAVASKAACSFNGNTIPHGTRVGVYNTTIVDGYCEVAPRVCNDGVLSAGSNLVSCSLRCTLGSKSLKLGDSASAYSSNHVPAGQNCSARTYVCQMADLGKTVAGYDTCTPDAPAAQPSCTYQYAGSNPLPAGASLLEKIQCSNIPAGARVNLVGKLNNANPVITAINLNTSGYAENNINNNEASLAGAWVRYVEVLSSSGAQLFKSANVTITLQAPAAANPSCVYQYVGVNPLPYGQSGTEHVACSNLPLGAVVKKMGTKDGGPLTGALVTLNASGVSDVNILNNEPSVAGMYQRHVEVYSAANVLLISTPNVSFTVSPNSASANCTLQFIGNNPLESGETGTQHVVCSNIPAGAYVKLVGTKDGAAEINSQISLSASGVYDGNIVNSNVNVAGVYRRRVELYSSANVMVASSAYIDISVRPFTGTSTPSCSYQWVGPNPLPSGASASEHISCSGLPAGAIVKLVGTKDGAAQINQSITLNSSGVLENNYVNNVTGISGVYVRHIEVYSGANLILSSPEISVVLQPYVVPSCTYQWNGPSPLPSGGSGYERVSCQNLPTGAVVKLVGTKDGVPQINAVLTLDGAGVFTGPVVNNTEIALAGAYVRHLEVYNSVNDKIFTTPDISVTVQLYIPPVQASCTYEYLTGVSNFSHSITIASGSNQDVYKCTQYSYVDDNCSVYQTLKVSCSNGSVSEASTSGSSCNVGYGQDSSYFPHASIQTYCNGDDLVMHQCLNGSFGGETLLRVGACYQGP